MVAQPDMPACLAAALAYAARGWRVFPLQPMSKKPFAGTRGLLDATTDEATIRRWWMRWPTANVAIACGNGIGVVDEDTYKGGDAGPLHLPPTLTATTPRGGKHMVYRVSGEIRPEHTGKLGKYVDFQGDGSYIVAPPSRTSDGVYAWLDEHQPVQDLPGRIVDMLKGGQQQQEHREGPRRENPTKGADKWVDEAIQRVRGGHARNNTGHWLAQQLYWNDQDVQTGMLTYQRTVQDWANPPYTEREAMATVREVMSQPKRDRARSKTATHDNRREWRERRENRTDGTSAMKDDPAPEPAQAPTDDLSQFGLAGRLLAEHSTNIRYNKAFGFVVWTGARWEIGADLTVQQWAMEIVERVFREVHEDDEATDEARKTALRRKTMATVDAMMRLIRPSVHMAPEAFDANPWLFNCANGTLNLQTGELSQHWRDDFLTQCSPIAYKADAQCPIFEAFVRQIMCARDELVSYIGRILGYCLTGDVSEQIWHRMVGAGANGKSTLMEALAYVLGDYAGVLEPEAICTSGRPTDAGAATPHLAALKGKRFVRVTETEQGARLAVARIKRMVGGDAQSARFLHRDLFTYIPNYKLFIYTNHKPQARETGHAFWRRVRYIPFDWSAKGAPRQKDKHLPEKLKTEAEGILAWLVRGCKEWQQVGLNPPQVVLDATSEYERESDVIGLFLAERCVMAESYSTRGRALYEAYKEWCDEAGEKYLAERNFGMALTDRGFKKAELRDANYWLGIGLKSREG